MTINLLSIFVANPYECTRLQVLNKPKTRPHSGFFVFTVESTNCTDSEFFVNESTQVVPLSDAALPLIDKYQGVENLPKISNAKYNDWLKQVQHVVGIKLKITVKIARKTFTNVMLNELGVSEESVAAILGHSSTKHVRYYGKANEERIAKEVVYEIIGQNPS